MSKKTKKADVIAKYLTESMKRQYQPKEKYPCPKCGRRFRGDNLKEHIAKSHMTKKVRMALFGTMDIRVVQEGTMIGQSARESERRRLRNDEDGPIVRSSENRRRDEVRPNRPVLDPNSTNSPASNITWATGRKRRP